LNIYSIIKVIPAPILKAGKNKKYNIMINYIEPIKAELDEKMNLHCSVFITIGSPKETPRYYNFGGFNDEENTIIIASSQNSKLFFEVSNPFEWCDFDVTDFWQQFKEYRTNFLKTNYPTIETI
jgi:hypothetical protein